MEKESIEKVYEIYARLPYLFYKTNSEKMVSIPFSIVRTFVIRTYPNHFKP